MALAVRNQILLKGEQSALSQRRSIAVTTYLADGGREYARACIPIVHATGGSGSRADGRN
jgi:hypothetical protein